MNGDETVNQRRGHGVTGHDDPREFLHLLVRLSLEGIHRVLIHKVKEAQALGRGGRHGG